MKENLEVSRNLEQIISNILAYIRTPSMQCDDLEFRTVSAPIRDADKVLPEATMGERIFVAAVDVERLDSHDNETVTQKMP
jgi:hypothetical protein